MNGIFENNFMKKMDILHNIYQVNYCQLSNPYFGFGLQSNTLMRSLNAGHMLEQMQIAFYLHCIDNVGQLFSLGFRFPHLFSLMLRKLHMIYYTSSLYKSNGNYSAQQN